ncbi:MAG: hypothetical protein D6759_17080, partial [Chloroflexi bacterium]
TEGTTVGAPEGVRAGGEVAPPPGGWERVVGAQAASRTNSKDSRERYRFMAFSSHAWCECLESDVSDRPRPLVAEEQRGLRL